MRLFVALWVELPPPLQDWLQRARQPPPPAPGAAGTPVRWIRPEAAHITLQFLGSVSEPRIAKSVAIAAALEGVRHPPVRVALRGVGAFPDLRRPAALWAGVASPGAVSLAAAVHAALRSSGLVPDARPYQPHLTLARSRRPADLRRALDATQPLPAEWGRQTLAEFLLLESRPGSRYAPLRSFPLVEQ